MTRTGFLALLLVAALGGGCRSGERPVRPELSPAPGLPDLEDLDTPVRRQLSARHDFVERRLRDERTSPAGLAWAFGQLGRTYHAYMLLEPARTCYRNARALDPDDFSWAYLLGHVERTLGQLDVSTAVLEEARSLRPGYVPTLVWLGENDLDQNRTESAEARFQEALRRDPGCIKAALGLARVALREGDARQALSYLEPAFAAEPEAHEIHQALGLAYRQLGDVDRARSLLESVPPAAISRISISFKDPLLQDVSELRRSAQYHARLGMRAVARERFRAAVSEFEQALAVDPDRADARYNLAAAHLKLGQRRRSREQLEELIERDPEHAPANVLLARILTSEGQVLEAERHLRRALASDSRSIPAREELAKLLRATGRLRGGPTARGRRLRDGSSAYCSAGPRSAGRSECLEVAAQACVQRPPARLRKPGEHPQGLANGRPIGGRTATHERFQLRQAGQGGGGVTGLKTEPGPQDEATAGLMPQGQGGLEQGQGLLRCLRAALGPAPPDAQDRRRRGQRMAQIDGD